VQFGSDGVVANAIMPGSINTGLQDHLADADLLALGWTQSQDGTPAPPAGWQSAEAGAATTVWAALAPELEGKGGNYLQGCAVAQPWMDEEPAERLLPASGPGPRACRAALGHVGEAPRRIVLAIPGGAVRR